MIKPFKRISIILLILTIVSIQASQVHAAKAVNADAPSVEAQSAIVLDRETGKILYKKDAYSKREPASTTKIITCLLVLDKLDLNETITISGKTETVGNVIGLKDGERIQVKDLLYALMVYSANDAAVAFAKEIGGSVEQFSKMMNQKAKECGAKDSYFMNPNGLNWQGQEAHLTTAYDLAVISREAMKNKTFRQLVTTKEYTIPATNKSPARQLKSTNLCLIDSNEQVTVDGVKRPAKYEGTVGIKTGLTSTAGACYVGSISKDGAELITVVLHSGDKGRFADSIALWEFSLDNYYDAHKMVKQGEELEKVRVKRGAHRSVMTVAEQDASAYVLKGESAEDLDTEFVPKDVRAPIKKGQPIGVIKVYDGKELVSTTRALAAEKIEEGGLLSIFGIADWVATVIYITIVLVGGIVIILYLLGRRNSRRSERRRRRKRRQRRRERHV